MKRNPTVWKKLGDNVVKTEEVIVKKSHQLFFFFLLHIDSFSINSYSHHSNVLMKIHLNGNA